LFRANISFIFFIKFNFSKKLNFINYKKLKKFHLTLQNNSLVRFPRLYFLFNIFYLKIEIFEKIYSERNFNFSNDFSIIKDIFESKFSNKSKKYNLINWKMIVNNSILFRLKKNFSITFEYLNNNLKKDYVNTGAHFDLNQNNIFFKKSNIYIVDWELFDPNGSYIWDLVWLLCNSLRQTSNSPNDIKSINNKLGNGYLDISNKEILIVYSLIKLRNDHVRHHRDYTTIFNDFIRRIDFIKLLYD
jgi:hypothetical protein